MTALWKRTTQQLIHGTLFVAKALIITLHKLSADRWAIVWFVLTVCLNIALYCLKSKTQMARKENISLYSSQKGKYIAIFYMCLY